jgi:hypothetical protein
MHLFPLLWPKLCVLRVEKPKSHIPDPRACDLFPDIVSSGWRVGDLIFCAVVECAHLLCGGCVCVRPDLPTSRTDYLWYLIRLIQSLNDGDGRWQQRSNNVRDKDSCPFP